MRVNGEKLQEVDKFYYLEVQRSKTGVVTPTVVYGSETWSYGAQERRKIEVFEMMCLRNICGIRRVDRVRNSIIREVRV